MNISEIANNKDLCCGCNACATICPTQAIQMIEDEVGQSPYAGDGPLLNQMRSIAENYGIAKNTFFWGIQSDVRKFYEAADIFFLPSLFEGLPLAGIEAQAMGLPSVISDTVTKELVYTDLVEFVPLNTPIDVWIKMIEKQMKRIPARRSYTKELENSIFSSANAGLKLEGYYRNLIEAYCATLYNKDDLYRSASGGAAYGLGLAHLTSGGIVYGVAYSEDYRNAEYTRIEKVEELSKLQDTKYFHANERSKKKVYDDIKRDLEKQRAVLVFGLPCEIAALRKVFDCEYRLTLIELFCHGVTSVETHEKYLNENIGTGNIESFTVKSKIKGWKKNPYILLNTSEGKRVHKPFYSSEYGYAFAHLSRESCYECYFKGAQRVGDISIGDFWGILNTEEDYDKDGVSVIQVHTSKGKELIDESKEYLQIKAIDSNMAILDNAWVNKSIPLGDRKKYAMKFASKNRIYVPIKVKLKWLLKAVLGKN